MAFPWATLALQGAQRLSQMDEKKRLADFEATKNKWSPYMNTSGLRTTPQQGLLSSMLGAYDKSTTEEGRNEAMTTNKNVMSDLKSLLSGLSGGGSTQTLPPDYYERP